MFHFIDQRLLCNELRAAAHAVLSNATGLHRGVRARGSLDLGSLVLDSGENRLRWVRLAVAGGQLGLDPQFKPFSHRGPSSQSLTRLKNWQPFDASLTCLCGQVFLGEGQLGYRLPSEDALRSAEVIFSKWLNPLDAQTFPCS
jgi:hypothetical protein